jgi:hypothetical protein
MTGLRRALPALALVALTTAAAAVRSEEKTPPPPQAGVVGGSAEELRERAALIDEIVEISEPQRKQKKWVEYQTGELDGWYERTLRETIAKAGLTDQLAPKLTPEVVRAAQERYRERIGSRLTNEIDYNKVYHDAYQKAFNEFFTLEELRQVVAFYRTPAGRKLARDLPDLMVNVLDTQAVIGDYTARFIDEEFAGEVERLKKLPPPR